MIHAASRQALAVVRERLDALLNVLPDGVQTKMRLASELYAVADLLVAQPRLRRTVADPATDAAGRSALVRSLLSGKVSEPATDLAATVVEQRWSSAWDLTDSFELLGDDTLLAGAQQQGDLDTVEDELFRFERIVAGSGQLASAMDEAAAPAERRVQLVRTLLGGKANPITVELVAHAVASGRKRSVELAVEELLTASAERQNRAVARVISASVMSDEQIARLSATLTTMYGRPISVRTAIDPDVMGGLVVRVGDEVIDGSVATKLAAARAALAG
jgi:F-type H+-transporting ATPase subunit delta